MFSSNDTPAEEFQMADRLGAIINLDDLTLVDYLERSIGHDAGEDLLPLQSRRRVHPGRDPGGLPGDGQSRRRQVRHDPRPDRRGIYRALAAMGAKEFGIHAFLASNTLSNDYYPALARILFQLAAELKAETGCPYHLHQPLRRRGRFPTARSSLQMTSPSSARASARPMRRCWCPPGWVTWPCIPSWAAS